MKLEHLDWDSDFFRIKIGRVLCDNCCCSYMELISIMEQAKQNNYDLLYVLTNNDELLPKEFIRRNNGLLVDRKVIFEMEVKNVSRLKSKMNICEYESQNLNNELLELAYLSGQHSRFLLDKNFSDNSFYRLYKEWIQKSLSKELADKVFVSIYNKKIVGFITLKRTNDNEAKIGLIAVSKDMQGKNIGGELIMKCLYYLNEKKIDKLYVATQYENKQACSFYKKNNFRKYSLTNIYHFWL